MCTDRVQRLKNRSNKAALRLEAAVSPTKVTCDARIGRITERYGACLVAIAFLRRGCPVLVDLMACLDKGHICDSDLLLQASTARLRSELHRGPRHRFWRGELGQELLIPERIRVDVKVAVSSL